MTNRYKQRSLLLLIYTEQWEAYRNGECRAKALALPAAGMALDRTIEAAECYRAHSGTVVPVSH